MVTLKYLLTISSTYGTKIAITNAISVYFVKKGKLVKASDVTPYIPNAYVIMQVVIKTFTKT